MSDAPKKRGLSNNIIHKGRVFTQMCKNPGEAKTRLAFKWLIRPKQTAHIVDGLDVDLLREEGIIS